MAEIAIPSNLLHIASASSLSTRSTLLKTKSCGFCNSPKSDSIFSTESICCSNLGFDISTMCRSKSASSSSSSVALKAAKMSLGRSRIKPTVSVIITSLSLGNLSRLLAVSSVANILSSTNVLLLVRLLSNVDLPALVYPIIDIMGICCSTLSAFLCCLARLSDSSCFSRRAILSLTLLLSTSSFISPGPLPPIPPINRDMAVPLPVNFGSLYLNWASSTWTLPSLLCARLAKISKINCERSMTFNSVMSLMAFI